MSKAEGCLTKNNELIKVDERNYPDYASILKILLYATMNDRKAEEILVRCENENKRLIAFYPGTDLIDPVLNVEIENFECIGDIIDGTMYLVPIE